MAQYLYRNGLGAERTIELPMREMDASYEYIRVDDDGTWDRTEYRRDDCAEIFHRVFTNPSISVEKDQSIDYRKTPPISRSLPRRKMGGATEENYHGTPMFRHKDGALTNKVGQPVIDGKSAMKRECARTGFVRGGSDE